MTTPKDLVAEISSLISLPTVALRIEQVLADENASLADAARIIEADPALASRLLKLSNSAAFGGLGSIDNVTEAITRVGTRQVRELVMGLELASSFNGLPNELISVEDFWRHSLYCAILSRKLAATARVRKSDAAFTAGLLHDIGQLVLFARLPDASRRFLRRSLDDSDGRCTDAAERLELGFDHGDVGQELASQWGFPESLRQCIYAHHRPSLLNPVPDLVYVVHIANSLAVLAELDSLDWQSAPPVVDDAWRALNLSPDCAEHVIREAKQETEELLELFIPK